MATEDAMPRFLVERVLGWPWTPDDGPLGGGWWRTDWGERIFHPPDFTTWEGFGLLLTALAKAGRAPSIEGYGDLWEVVLFEEYHTPHKVTRDSPQRALMLAAAKAYGWKEGV